MNDDIMVHTYTWMIDGIFHKTMDEHDQVHSGEWLDSSGLVISIVDVLNSTIGPVFRLDDKCRDEFHRWMTVLHGIVP